ncbi:uncharacterized protein [Clytia hemisphaerica]|uniref:uncharacterized protein isoform X1 n=1 Tax=Clytia hemisphaerica TaxID=252671 RepID=UPI0034D3B9CE
MDYRKSFGINDNKLRCFTITEVYLRRAKENLRKKKRLDGTRNFDLETLIGRDSWATLEEMEGVIPYHIFKFKEIVNKCKVQQPLPNKQELTFCTRFITTFLFLRVKCSRPMTFQYLTLTMIEKAKQADGFIDQREFKTTAIGKYIHPTRYRQIVETTSADRLSRSEQEIISEDQKHSSDVAKVHYKKKQSRIVATQGRQCMEKMLGTTRKDHQEACSGVLRDLAAMSRNTIESQPIQDAVASSASSTSTNNHIPMIVDSDDDAFEPSNIEAQCTEVNNIMQRVQSMCSTSPLTNQNLNESRDVQMEVVRSTVSSTPKRPQNSKSYDKRRITESVEVKKETAIKETRKSSRNIKFSQEEDEELLKGIQKHGEKNWAAIIKDKTFDFHPSRTRDSLRVRADSAKFKKLLEM